MSLSAIALAVLASPAGATASCRTSPHAPIRIASDSDFTSANGVVSGSGTSANPYLLANLAFSDWSKGYALKIGNSKQALTKFFNVLCVTGDFTTIGPSGAVVVWLVNIHTATTIAQVDVNSGEAPGSVGIRVESSSLVTLANESINKFGGDGIQLLRSDHITVIESKLKAFLNGLTIRDSHDITVGQACDLNSQKGCNEFTYDDGRGIDVINSYNIVIQGTITSADDSGGILLEGSGTHDVVLKDGTATANGPICAHKEHTGSEVDTIAGIAVTTGAHDITVTGYTIQANGDGAGGYFDIMNGGNGLYLDPCTGVVVSVPQTPPAGANVVFIGTCYNFEYGFTPVPASSC